MPPSNNSQLLTWLAQVAANLFAQKFSPLILLVMLFCCTGATCIPKRSLNEFQPPIIFEQPPSLPELAEVINRTSKLQQLQTNAITVRMPDLPALSATLDYQREKNFRMKGGVSRLTGVDFDIGSNDDIFWMSSRHDLQPTLYFAYHNQFESQLNRQVLPVSPLWLVEAMGIVSLDPSLVTEPPQVGPDGLLRVNSIVPSPVGPYQRTMHVDAKEGTIRQIMLRDPTGRLLANAVLSNHQYYSGIETSLPHNSKIELLPVGSAPLTMQVEVGFYRINDDVQQDPAKFANPAINGFQVVDLANLNAGQNAAPTAPGYRAAEASPAADFRGVDFKR